MENVELLKDWCQKFFLLHLLELSAVFFCSAIHASVRTPICFTAFSNTGNKKKNNCTNPSDSQQLWFYSRSSLALSSTHQKKKSELTETMQ